MNKPKNKFAQELAKMRLTSMTPERRKEIASIAAKKRWEKKGGDELSPPSIDS